MRKTHSQGLIESKNVLVQVKPGGKRTEIVQLLWIYYENKLCSVI